jgi:hypothetical protein
MRPQSYPKATSKCAAFLLPWRSGWDMANSATDLYAYEWFSSNR